MPALGQKPRVPIVQWGHPLSRGLAFCYMARYGEKSPRDILGNKLATTEAGFSPSGSYTRGGKYGDALALLSQTNNNENIDFGLDSRMDFTNKTGFTASVWVKLNAVDGVVFGKQLIGLGGWMIWPSSSTQIDFYINNASRANTAITLSTWRMITARWDRANVDIAVDGAFGTAAAWSTDVGSSALDLGFGRYQAGHGPMCEIAGAMLWNRPLTNREVQALYGDPWAVITPADLWDQSNLVGAFMNGPLAPPASGGVGYPFIFPQQSGTPFGGMYR